MKRKLQEFVTEGVTRATAAVPDQLDITETAEAYEITIPVAQGGRVPVTAWYDTELNMPGCDLARGNDGNMPLGVIHSSKPEGRRRDNIIGRVMKVELRDDRFFATLNFPKDNARVMDAWNDVKTKVLRNASIRAVPTDPEAVRFVEGDMTKGIKDLIVFERTTLVDVVLCPYPGDNRVGIGRSLTEAEWDEIRTEEVQRTVTEEEKKAAKEAAEKAKEIERGNPGGDPPADPPAKQPETKPSQPEEVKRTASEIYDMTRGEIETWAKEEEVDFKPEFHDAIRREVLRELNDARSPTETDFMKAGMKRIRELKRDKGGDPGAAGFDPTAGKAPAHVKNPGDQNAVTDCGRMIEWGVADTLGGEKPDLGVERELLQDWEEKQKDKPFAGESRVINRANDIETTAVFFDRTGGNFFIPYDIILRDPQAVRALGNTARGQGLTEAERAVINTPFTAGDPATGYHQAVFDPNWVIERLLSVSVFKNFVRVIAGELDHEIKGVVEAGRPAISRTGETDAIAESAGFSVDDSPMLKWHQYTGLITTTKKALDIRPMTVDRIVDVLSEALAHVIDVDIPGKKTLPTGAIAGILNSAGVPNVSVAGANGGPPTHGLFTQMIGKLGEANAMMNRAKFALDTGVYAKTLDTQKFTGSGGIVGAITDTTIRGGDKNLMGSIEAVDVFTSNNIDRTFTKGTGTNLRAVILGDFYDYLLGAFSAIEILVDPYTQAGNSKIRIFIRQAITAYIRHLKSFVTCSELTV